MSVPFPISGVKGTESVNLCPDFRPERTRVGYVESKRLKSGEAFSSLSTKLGRRRSREGGKRRSSSSSSWGGGGGPGPKERLTLSPTLGRIVMIGVHGKAKRTSTVKS